MRDEIKAVIFVQATNLMKVALFVLLARCFEKWWIALFALLFMTDYKYKYSDNDEVKE